MLRERHVSGYRFPHDSLAHVSCLLSVSYYDMDFVRDYESDSSSSGGTEYADLDNSCKPANPNDKIDVRSVRKLYLITYSQADVGCFPPRQSFVEAVLYSFYDRPDKIMHWSCCMEEHPASGGSYFQTALKLNRNKGRLSSKKVSFRTLWHIRSFFSIHRNYFSAWKYVTKQDKEFLESPGHLDLSDGLP